MGCIYTKLGLYTEQSLWNITAEVAASTQRRRRSCASRRKLHSKAAKIPPYHFYTCQVGLNAFVGELHVLVQTELAAGGGHLKQSG